VDRTSFAGLARPLPWRYHACLPPEVVSTPIGTATWEVIGPVNDGKHISAIQPSILDLGGGRLLVLGRTGNSKRIFQVESADAGRAWTPVVTLETEPGEFSYPAIIQAADGRVHLTYTWNRKKIAHAVIDLSQLHAKGKQDSWEAR